MKNSLIRNQIIISLKAHVGEFGERVFPLSGIKREAKNGAFAEVSSGATVYESLGNGIYEKKVPMLVQVIFPATTENIQEEADEFVVKIAGVLGNLGNFAGLVDDVSIKTSDSAVSNNAAVPIGYCEVEFEVTYV